MVDRRDVTPETRDRNPLDTPKIFMDNFKPWRKITRLTYGSRCFVIYCKICKRDAVKTHKCECGRFKQDLIESRDFLNLCLEKRIIT